MRKIIAAATTNSIVQGSKLARFKTVGVGRSVCARTCALGRRHGEGVSEVCVRVGEHPEHLSIYIFIWHERIRLGRELDSRRPINWWLRRKAVSVV